MSFRSITYPHHFGSGEPISGVTDFLVPFLPANNATADVVPAGFNFSHRTRVDNAALVITQGTTDVQVRVANAKRLADGNPGAQLVVIDGMNHVLKTVAIEEDKQVSSYGDPSLPVTPDLIGAISRFVDKIRG